MKKADITVEKAEKDDQIEKLPEELKVGTFKRNTSKVFNVLKTEDEALKNTVDEEMSEEDDLEVVKKPKTKSGGRVLRRKSKKLRWFLNL